MTRPVKKKTTKHLGDKIKSKTSQRSNQKPVPHQQTLLSFWKKFDDGKGVLSGDPDSNSIIAAPEESTKGQHENRSKLCTHRCPKDKGEEDQRKETEQNTSDKCLEEDMQPIIIVEKESPVAVSPPTLVRDTILGKSADENSDGGNCTVITDKSTIDEQFSDEENASISSTDERSTTHSIGEESISTSTAGQEDELCEYEKLRLRNITRNNARLAELGLLTNVSDVSLSSGRTKQAQSKRRKLSGNAASRSKTTTIATRRSTRLRKSVVPISQSTNNDGDLEAVISHVPHDAEVTDQVYEVTEQYEVSPLVEYTMTDVTNTEQQISEMSSSNNYDGAVTSLIPDAARLNPPQGLEAIYSLQFYPNSQNTSSTLRNSWLVGAGKSGIVSLWNTRAGDLTSHTDNIDPVLSWKSHSGRWISDALFLPPSSSLSSSSNCVTSSPQRLITAANDGCVCIWNLTEVSVQSGAPKLLFKSGKELHSSGIFSMDVKSSISSSVKSQDILIATGSKDKTVALLTLDSLEHNANPIWRSNYHSRKVGAVQLNPSRGSNLVASASDDGLVGVHDFRKKSIAAELKDAHEKPHSVVWDPNEEKMLMTAGLDPVIKLWDIRQMNAPMSSYHSHVPLCTTRCKRIHSPAFYHPGSQSETRRGSFILTGGEGSHSLSMFQQQPLDYYTRVFSRGKLPPECGDVGRIAVDNDHVAAAVGGGEILLLKPKYN